MLDSSNLDSSKANNSCVDRLSFWPTTPAYDFRPMGMLSPKCADSALHRLLSCVAWLVRSLGVVSVMAVASYGVVAGGERAERSLRS